MYPLRLLMSEVSEGTISLVEHPSVYAMVEANGEDDGQESDSSEAEQIDLD